MAAARSVPGRRYPSRLSCRQRRIAHLLPMLLIVDLTTAFSRKETVRFRAGTCSRRTSAWAHSQRTTFQMPAIIDL